MRDFLFQYPTGIFLINMLCMFSYVLASRYLGLINYRRNIMAVPKYDELFNPLLRAIKNLGGSASISELEEEVIKDLHLTDKDIAELHDDRRTKLEYRLAWVRTYLKTYGLLDNSERGVWVLTSKGKETENV